MSSRRARAEAAESMRARIRAERVALRDQGRARRGLPPYHCWRDAFDEPELMIAIGCVYVFVLLVLNQYTGYHLDPVLIAVLAVALTVVTRRAAQATEPDDEE